MEDFFLKNLSGESGDPTSASEKSKRLDNDIFDGRFPDYKSVLGKLDAELEARIGYSRTGTFTETQRDAIGRVAEKITSSETGNFADEAVLSSAVELSHFIKTSLSLGGENEPRETAHLAGDLESVLQGFGDGKIEGEIPEMDKEKFIDAVALLAEIESRLERSYYQKNEPAFPASEEYLHMDVLLAQGKVILRRIAKANQDFVPEGKNFDEFLECLRGIADLGFDGENRSARKNNLVLKKMRHNPAVFKKLTNRISSAV
ncbi:MAG: hypothetical protein WC120_01190 [Parcubacteria group bacterium]